MRWLLPLLLLAACGTAPAPEREAAPPGCPARAGLEVPAAPTADRVGRLVPPAVPASALVCRYADLADDDTSALVGESALTDLGGLPADLLLPGSEGGSAGACVSAPGPVTPLLLRLAYDDGVVWVAASEQADPCRGAANGRFRSGEDVGDVLAASAAAGRWTVPPLPDAGERCVPERTGRRGIETALLPQGVRALVLCRVAGDGVTRRAATAADLATVQDVLEEPVAVIDPRACPGGGDQYELAARYDAGPAVLVQYSAGCTPQVDNGWLRADLSGPDRERLEAVLRQTGA